MTKVMMVLARGPDHPAGNLDDRLDLQVQLTAQGQLDTVAWETGNTPWLTSRRRSDHPQRDGELVKLEDSWAIRNLDNEDDPLLAFSAAIMRPGEIATVIRLDGKDLVYRIVAVEAG
jgi:hypothetical protein